MPDEFRFTRMSSASSAVCRARFCALTSLGWLCESLLMKIWWFSVSWSSCIIPSEIWKMHARLFFPICPKIISELWLGAPLLWHIDDLQINFSDSVFPRLHPPLPPTPLPYLNITTLSWPPPESRMMINRGDMSRPRSFIVLMTCSYKLFRPVTLLCIRTAYFKICLASPSWCGMCWFHWADLNFSGIVFPLFNPLAWM